KLSKALSKETIRHPLEAGIKKITLLLLRSIKQATPQDMGMLESRIVAEVHPLYGKVGTIVQYAPFIEFGTKPHFPPVEPIEAWASRHGMAGMGFVIARAISRRGTQPEHLEGKVTVKGQGPFSYGSKLVMEKFSELLKEIGAAIQSKWNT
ncbi:MAG: hypothetical protein KKD44_29570, partial [Proteobacteria bacterium]|nr:hypothetical protein [Pseudomonadota bacterium]